MTRGSELMLYVLLGIPVVVIGLFLLTMGPLGWFLAAFLGVAIIGATAVLGESPDAEPDRVNCSHCGSRTSPGGPCDYCGEAP